MARMTGKKQPVEALIILEDGSTLNFKVSLGDTISLERVDTIIGKRPTDPKHVYYTATLVYQKENGNGQVHG